MFVPFVTQRSRKLRPRPKFDRRDESDDVVKNMGEIRLGGGGRGGGSSSSGSKGGSGTTTKLGGGGKGGGGGGGGSKGGSSGGRGGRGGSGSSGGDGGDDGGDDDGDGGSSSGGSSGGKGSSSGIGTSSGGGSSPATTFGRGSGRSVVIPNGQPFAGRSAGGGTRGLIYGTNQYGSGYPGVTGLGTAGRGFPFYFWPVVWGGAYTGYLDPTDYGSPTNTSRPGGPLATAAFPSNTSNTTFRILSDNQTVVDLIGTITSSCSSNLQTTNITATPYNDSNTLPNPDQAVQYYRASSIALTLDGYNNTADLSNGTNVPLPSNIDYSLLDCMNATIGTTAPLVNAASGSSMSTSMIRTAPVSGLLGLVWIIWMLLYLS